MEQSTLIRLCLLLAVLSILSPYAGAHSGEEAITPTDLDSISPFHAFSEGRILFGIILSIIWIALAHGVYTLALLVLSRLITDTKTRPSRKKR